MSPLIKPCPFLVSVGGGAGGINTYSSQHEDNDVWQYADPTGTVLKLSTAVTFELWFKTDSTATLVQSQYAIWGTGTTTQSYLFHYFGSGAARYIRIVYRNDSDDALTDIRQVLTVVPVVDTWEHWACSVDLSLSTASQCEFYRDSTPLGNGAVSSDGSVTAFADQGTQAFWIAAATSATQNNLVGHADQCRIWTGVIRTPAQIAANYNAQLVGDEDANLVLWKMNDGSGTTATDSGGNSLDLTAVNSPTFDVDVPFV